MAMTKAWIDPHQIEDVWVMNNRKENQGHIESLAESMRLRGFILDYPLVVFKAEGIGILTDKPYVMACGHHRRKGAITAGLEQVLCEIHDGGEEDWIEMMATDNFKFDVAKNPSIGLAFTETERRAACRQLFLLPKFMEQTNTALSAEWNVPESTVRRWRKEIEGLLKADGAQLNIYHISEDRKVRLKEIIASEKRINTEGEEVTTKRTAKPEMTDSERRSFWYTVRQAFWQNRGSDGLTFDDRHEVDSCLLYTSPSPRDS